MLGFVIVCFKGFRVCGGRALGFRVSGFGFMIVCKVFRSLGFRAYRV